MRGKGLASGVRSRLLQMFATVTGIEFLQNVVRNAFEHLARKCSKQLPTDVQGIGDRSILVGS